MRYYCSRCGKPTELAADQSFGFCRFCGEKISADDTELNLPGADSYELDLGSEESSPSEAVEDGQPAFDYQKGVRRMWVHVWSMLMPAFVITLCALPFLLVDDFGESFLDAFAEWAVDGYSMDYTLQLAGLCALTGLIVFPYMVSVRITAGGIRVAKGWLIPKIVKQLISIALFMVLGIIVLFIYVLVTQSFMPEIVNLILCAVIILAVVFFTFVYPFIQLKKSKATAAFMNKTRYQREKIVELNNAANIEGMKSNAKMAGRVVSWPIRAIFGAFLEGLSGDFEWGNNDYQGKTVSERISEENDEIMWSKRNNGEIDW